MSVTFQIEGNTTGDFTAHCYERDLTLGPVTGYEAILPVMAAHKAECDECMAYGLYSQPVMDVSDEFDVNVANTNARLLLVALGLDDADEYGDLAGRATGDDFMARVMLAMAADRDDSGVRSAVIGGAEVGQRGATMIDCGLPAGYYAERFSALYALGAEAARLGRDIHWS